MKHTKGKWKSFTANANGFGVTNGDTVIAIAGETDLKENEANANLIAAAPEMLSLLKRFLEAPGYKEGRDNTKWMLLEEMKAITIKAEGK